MATETIGDNAADDHAGCEDASLTENAPTTAQGGAATLMSHKYGAGDHAVMLIRFPGLTGIAAPVTVTAATLYWRMFTSGSGTTQNHDLHRVLRNWVEAQATWNVFSTGNSWTTPGCRGDGTDRVATPLIAATPIPGGNNDYNGISSAAFIQDVEDIINGVHANHGWSLERNGAGEDTFWLQVRSSEASDGDRPYLEVTYEVAGGGHPVVRRLQGQSLRPLEIGREGVKVA